SLRHEREVVVLDPDSGGTLGTSRLVQYCLRKTFIHVPVARPVIRSYHHVLDKHVARRPEYAVRKAQVVALHVRIVQPDATQHIALLIRGYPQPTLGIRSVLVRRTGTPRHPRP